MGDVAQVVADSFVWVIAALALYTVLINTSYLGLIGAAFLDLRRYRARVDFANYDEWFRDPNVHSVSVLIPAHNESAGILTTITAMSSLHYPDYEVVVIDDGSKDDTAELLITHLGMVEVPLLATNALPTKGTVTSTWMAKRGNITVTLVRSSGGGKADALNVGINYARKELVCCLDADSLLESTALLQVTRPFAERPNVVATGGVIRVANGAEVSAGRVVTPRIPFSFLTAVQVVEYMRAFFIGREGWSKVGGLIIISGAFGVFRTSTLVTIGGYAVDCIGEDAELIVRLHRHLHESGDDDRAEVVMVPEPVAWTEVPTSTRVLSRQRRRWHRGLSDVFNRHRRMVGNPRYGCVGVGTMPWFLAFELLAPVVELGGYLYLALVLTLGSSNSALSSAVGPDALDLGVTIGGLNWPVATALIGATLLYSVVITLLALLAEELTFARYRTNRDLTMALAGIVGENLGFRQLTLWWRLRGLVDGFRNRPTVWGDMERAGFGGTAEAPPAVAEGAARREREAAALVQVAADEGPPPR